MPSGYGALYIGRPGITETPASRCPSRSYWHEQNVCWVNGSRRRRPVSQHRCWVVAGLVGVGADDVTAMLAGGGEGWLGPEDTALCKKRGGWILGVFLYFNLSIFTSTRVHMWSQHVLPLPAESCTTKAITTPITITETKDATTTITITNKWIRSWDKVSGKENQRSTLPNTITITSRPRVSVCGVLRSLCKLDGFWLHWFCMVLYPQPHMFPSPELLSILTCPLQVADTKGLLCRTLNEKRDSATGF